MSITLQHATELKKSWRAPATHVEPAFSQGMDLVFEAQEELEQHTGEV